MASNSESDAPNPYSPPTETGGAIPQSESIEWQITPARRGAILTISWLIAAIILPVLPLAIASDLVWMFEIIEQGSTFNPNFEWLDAFVPQEEHEAIMILHLVFTALLPILMPSAIALYFFVVSFADRAPAVFRTLMLPALAPFANAMAAPPLTQGTLAFLGSARFVAPLLTWSNTLFLFAHVLLAPIALSTIDYTHDQFLLNVMLITFSGDVIMYATWFALICYGQYLLVRRVRSLPLEERPPPNYSAMGRAVGSQAFAFQILYFLFTIVALAVFSYGIYQGWMEAEFRTHIENSLRPVVSVTGEIVFGFLMALTLPAVLLFPLAFACILWSSGMQLAPNLRPQYFPLLAWIPLIGTGAVYLGLQSIGRTIGLSPIFRILYPALLMAGYLATGGTLLAISQEETDFLMLPLFGYALITCTSLIGSFHIRVQQRFHTRKQKLS